MKSKFVAFFLSICFFLLGCQREDNNQEYANIHGSYDLVRIYGGFIGIDQEYPKGLIKFNFQDGILTVESETQDQYLFLESGTYNYAIDESTDPPILRIDNHDMEIYSSNPFGAEFGQIVLDGFNYVLKR